MSNLLEGIETEVEEGQEVHEENIIDTAKLEEQLKQGQNVSLTKPEFIPDDFWNDEQKQVKLEDLYKAYDNEKRRADGLRQKLSKGIEKAPTKAEEYKIEASEGIEGYINDDDPLIESLKGVGVKLGLDNSTLNGIVNEVTKDLVSKGIIEKPISSEEQALAESRRKDEELLKLGNDAPKKLAAIKLYGDSLLNKGLLTKEEHAEYSNMVTNATQAQVMLKLRAAAGEQSIPLVSDGASGLPSKDEWQAMAVAKDANGGLRVATEAGYFNKLEKIRQQMAQAGMI